MRAALPSFDAACLRSLLGVREREREREERERRGEGGREERD